MKHVAKFAYLLLIITIFTIAHVVHFVWNLSPWKKDFKTFWSGACDVLEQILDFD